MNKPRWLMTGCLLATVAVLIAFTSVSGARERRQVSGYSPSSPVSVQQTPLEIESTSEELDQGSEHYLLVALEVGYIVGAMQSESYSLNQGVAVRAEGAPPLSSENYRVEGIVRYWRAIPAVLKGY